MYYNISTIEGWCVSLTAFPCWYQCCEWKVSPAISANRGCFSYQAISHAVTPRCAVSGDLRGRRAEYGPYIDQVDIKGMVSMSPDSPSSHTEKSAKLLEMSGFPLMNVFYFCHIADLSSLTKDWTQAMIKLRTLTARQPGDSVLCPTYLVFVTNFYISCLLPYLFREIPQNYLRGCFPGLSPQFCPPNKT